MEDLGEDLSDRLRVPNHPYPPPALTKDGPLPGLDQLRRSIIYPRKLLTEGLQVGPIT